MTRVGATRDGSSVVWRGHGVGQAAGRDETPVRSGDDVDDEGESGEAAHELDAQLFRDELFTEMSMTDAPS